MPRQKLEEKLYVPIVENLKSVYDYWYLDKSQIYSGKPEDKYRLQYSPKSTIRNPHLEITAHGKFSEELKLKKSDYYMFRQLFAEQLHPDILGYVVKNPVKNPNSFETIAVEVKAKSLLIRDLMQAKLYETIFSAKHTFLISPKGMTGEKITVVMKHNDLLRGNVIIAKCGENGKDLRIDPRLADYVPKEFRRFCKL
jgi:hypothetical protein